MGMNDSKKVFIAGTGKSGIAAAKLVTALGGTALLYNSDPETDREKVLSEFADGTRVDLITGTLYPGHLRGCSLACISPGIPLSSECVQAVQKSGVPMIGELELGYQAAKGKMAAITGTNGKTTTTSLVGELLRHAYADVKVAGNIGTPYTEVALLTTEASASVIEVSSFMLETIADFHPNVSAILNITPDHLDRHGSMAGYVECKKQIIRNQTEDDTVVLNYDDSVLRTFGESGIRPHVVWFSSQCEPEGEAVFTKDGKIFVKENGIVTELINVSELKIIGRHNYENACAAVAIALKMGVSREGICEGLREFRAVPHRIEFVRERCKVKYYNDSKGTNPDAAVQALLAMPGPTVLIGGGYDKGLAFDDWVKLFREKVKCLILMGATRNKILECCRKYGFKDVVFADDMEEAVNTAASYADEGDYVLLSPACASWDMFQSFEERGDIFKKSVMEL